MPERRRRIVQVLLLSGGVTYALSQTLILPAMPALVRELDADPLAVSWLLTAFLVAASVATPLLGRMGDMLGRGRVLSMTMAIFLLGSVLCALANSLGELIAGRVLQGAAGGVFPLAYGIIRDTFPRADRMRTIGILSVSLGVGAAFGPVVAGAIVDHAPPSTIFWVPTVGALPGLAAAWVVPDGPARTRAAIDWSGGVLLAGWLSTLLVLMTQGGHLGWTSAPAVALLAVTAGLVAWWLRVERGLDAPLVDLGVMRERTVALANAASLCIGCGIFMAYTPIAPMAQAPPSTGYGLALSVGAAGALLVPHGVVQVLVGRWAGSLCAQIGPRAPLLIGTSLNAATMAVLSVYHGGVAQLLVGGAALGLGQAFALTAMGNLVVAAAPRTHVGIATGMNTVMRTLGMAFGSALSAAILAAATPPGGAFAGEHGYVAAFALASVVTTVAVACAAALPRRRVTIAEG